MHPAGQQALIRDAVSAGLTGLLLWVVCALVARAIIRTTLKPYDALADHFERLADGHVDGPLDLRGPVTGVGRLARAVAVFQHKAQTSQRAQADLQARYDSLVQEQADERRLLMGMLMSGRLDPGGQASGRRSPAGPAAADFDIPESSAAARAEGGPPPHSGRYDSLYQESPDERRLLMGLLMSSRFEREGPASALRSSAGAAPESVRGPTAHTGRVIDPAGRMAFSPRKVAERPPETPVAPELMLDFALLRR